MKDWWPRVLLGALITAALWALIRFGLNQLDDPPNTVALVFVTTFFAYLLGRWNERSDSRIDRP